MQDMRLKEGAQGFSIVGALRRLSRTFFGILTAVTVLVLGAAEGLAQDDIVRVDPSRVEEWSFDRRSEFLGLVERSLTSMGTVVETLERGAHDEASRRPLTGLETSLRAINRRVEAARSADEKRWSTAKLRLIEGLSDIYRQFDSVRSRTVTRTQG